MADSSEGSLHRKMIKLCTLKTTKAHGHLCFGSMQTVRWRPQSQSRQQAAMSKAAPARPGAEGEREEEGQRERGRMVTVARRCRSGQRAEARRRGAGCCAGRIGPGDGWPGRRPRAQQMAGSQSHRESPRSGSEALMIHWGPRSAHACSWSSMDASASRSSSSCCISLFC